MSMTVFKLKHIIPYHTILYRYIILSMHDIFLNFKRLDSYVLAAFVYKVHKTIMT